MAYRKEKARHVHKPYTVEVDDYGRSRRVYNELPNDEEIASLSYAKEILEIAVWDKVMFDRPTYRNPDEFTDYDRNWQYQCAVWEHVMRYAGLFSD